jgi:hypothetical protein
MKYTLKHIQSDLLIYSKKLKDIAYIKDVNEIEVKLKHTTKMLYLTITNLKDIKEVIK